MAPELPELLAFHASHYLLIKKGLTEQVNRLGLIENKVDYRAVQGRNRQT